MIYATSLRKRNRAPASVALTAEPVTAPVVPAIVLAELVTVRVVPAIALEELVIAKANKFRDSVETCCNVVYHSVGSSCCFVGISCHSAGGACHSTGSSCHSAGVVRLRQTK
ncbi:hypothetical protein [Butyrivibrio sp. JL13D10]|uniref:hypothetical protein n=1 Tax=Butyrivibrio sp. JL13D10 TaxID=3236815 RepID=UPI0038B6868F